MSYIPTTNQLPSDRKFGLTFGSILLAIALLPLWHSEPILRWALFLGVPLLILGVLSPHLLHPLNQKWMQLALLLHTIISPLLLGLLFYGVFTPIGLFLRWRGKNILCLQLEPEQKSYWIFRKSTISSQSFRNQF
ncbi:SxtJ family membrane protein [Pajaroellobacter abortibovis]|nr:SxtJ family membrane protein [Pajaroellobacter abortibovis]